MGRFKTGGHRSRTVYPDRKGKFVVRNDRTGEYTGPGTPPEIGGPGITAVRTPGGGVKPKYRNRPRTRSTSASSTGLDTLLRAFTDLRPDIELPETPKPQVDGRGKKNTAVRTQTRVSPPEKVEVPKGLEQKTLGTPTAKELIAANEAGKLKFNKRGQLTTPKTRKAVRQVKAARKRVAKSNRVQGPLTPGQKVFAKRLSQKTGLSPRVIAAWELAEQSGGAATQREAERNHNWLNIGYTDSGAIGITNDRTWSDPISAADATAEFLKGRFGGPSEGIQSILPRSRGKGDQQQIQAIAQSGWATNPAYEQSIRGTHQMVSATPSDPRAQQRLGRAVRYARQQGIPAKADVNGPAPPPKQVLTRLKGITRAAAALDKLQIPYVYGGGHVAGDVPDPKSISGLDCSSTVSWVLQQAGYDVPTAVSGQMMSWGKPGPGAVTIFANPGHVFMKIGNRYFGTSSTNPGGGPGFIDQQTGAAEAGSGKYAVRHLPGLGQKTAQALNIGLGPAASADGGGGDISYSTDGTTATVTNGTIKAKPGFSERPILPVAPIESPTAASAPLPEFFGGADAQPEAPQLDTDTTPFYTRQR